jgi:hypothetical protein
MEYGQRLTVQFGASVVAKVFETSVQAGPHDSDILAPSFFAFCTGFQGFDHRLETLASGRKVTA